MLKIFKIIWHSNHMFVWLIHKRNKFLILSLAHLCKEEVSSFIENKKRFVWIHKILSFFALSGALLSPEAQVTMQFFQFTAPVHYHFILTVFRMSAKKTKRLKFFWFLTKRYFPYICTYLRILTTAYICKAGRDFDRY